MRRATTPTHTFYFEDNPEEEFDQILITYVQNSRILLEKTKADLEFEEVTEKDGKTVYPASVQLTQEETRRFSSSIPVSVQVRALTYGKDAVASEIMALNVKDVLNSEVLE